MGVLTYYDEFIGISRWGFIRIKTLLFLDPISKNEPEECCNRPPHLKNPYCNEIPVPGDDYFYSKFNVKCIDFVRAFPSVRPGCRLGKEVYWVITILLMLFYAYKNKKIENLLIITNNL